jgi:hypothetical protein
MGINFSYFILFKIFPGLILFALFLGYILVRPWGEEDDRGQGVDGRNEEGSEWETRTRNEGRAGMWRDVMCYEFPKSFAFCCL